MKRYQRFSTAGILLAAVMLSTSQQVAAQVLRIAEMNTQQIWALNLQKTVVLIPGGILEEHGPYLPSTRTAMPMMPIPRTCEGHRRQTRWTVVLFPQIPLGNDPKHNWRKDDISGSYPVRMATLRAIYMDWLMSSRPGFPMDIPGS
jgi:creatinine amidohydrolase/Fe(II)-dependent formamide hydrolase-like protein